MRNKISITEGEARLSKPAMIFSPESRDARIGGPAGFVAQNLYGHSSKYAQLSPDLVTPDGSLKRIWRRIERATTALLVPEYYRWRYLSARHLFAQERVWEYQFVMFHDVFNLFYCLDLLKQNQKVILQPHMPELPSQEVASLGHSTPEIVRWVEKDVTPGAFSRADIVILPNDGVLPIYKSVISKSAKLVYLPSGAEQLHGVTQIPLDPQYLFFLYVGRRLPIKGFDLVIQAFKRAYEQRPIIRLILLGNGKKIDLEGVIDVGFTNAPHDWMASVDYVISANRQSYFDLTVLEALSVGAPLLISCTWGHRVLKDASPGIFDIGVSNVENIEMAFRTASSKRELNSEILRENHELFRREYSAEVYRNNLDHILGELIREQNSP